MEKLTLYIKQNEFIIHTEKTDLPHLRVCLGDQSKFFKKLATTTWSISAEQLLLLCAKENRTRLFIYYTDNGQEIDGTKFDVEFGQSLTLTSKESIFYTYISLDNKIRMSINQKPSARSYYLSNEPVTINTVNNNIEFTLSIQSKFAPLLKANLLLLNRQEGYTLEIIDTQIDSIKIQPNIYQNQCVFHIPPKLFFETLRPSFNYNEFDTTLVDFYFTIQIKQGSLTKYKFRIPFSETFETEVWCSYSDEKMASLFLYQTINGNLSTRIALLSNESYREYQSLLNTAEMKDNNIVLVCEYPYKAQDNGFYFFRYLMTKQNKFIPYYIITDDSKDLKKLKPYMDHVVIFKSKEHIRLLFEATYLMHTHASNYVLPFFSNELEAKKNAMKKIFLQHGITATKNMEPFYGRKTNPKLTDKIVVSSQRELQQIHEQLYYPLEDIKITGLARFDDLLKKTNLIKNCLFKRKILIMPSWRNDQDKLTNEEFQQTTFFGYYSDLISDPALEKLVKENGLTINFYLHNNFQKYKDLFHSNFVNILNAGDQTVHHLLKKHGVLITDYSSVGLDFAIQRRKVLYFQFDNNQREIKENLKSNHLFLPGPIFATKEQLLPAIQKATEDNRLETAYVDIVKTQLYPYYDSNACQRIFQVLEEL